MDCRGGALDVAGEAAVDADQAKVRSITPRFGCTTKPVSVRLMISTGRGATAATRGPMVARILAAALWQGGLSRTTTLLGPI